MSKNHYIVKKRIVQEITYFVPEIGQDVTADPATWPEDVYFRSRHLDDVTVEEEYTYIKMVDLEKDPMFYEDNVEVRALPKLWD